MDERAQILVSQLPRRLWGYRRDQVEALVGRMNGALDEAEALLRTRRVRLADLRESRAARQAQEQLLRDILVEAQLEARELEERAEAEREELLREAHRAAMDRRAALESERIGLRSALGELEAFERTLRRRTRFVLEQALGELSAAGPSSEPQGANVPGERADLVGNGHGGSRVEIAVALPDGPSADDGSTQEPVPLEDEPTTEESALAAPADAASGRTGLLPGRGSVGPEGPTLDRVGTGGPDPPQFPLPPESDERIRIVVRREEPGSKLPPAGEQGRAARGRSLLAALALVLALAGTGVAVAVLLAGGRGSATSPPTLGAQDASTIAAGSSVSGGGNEEFGASAAATVAGERPASRDPKVTDPETTGKELTSTPPAAGPKVITLSISATSGDSWLEVRRGSAAGELLFQGFLLRGEARTFEAKRFWARIGQPTSLTVEIDGKVARNLPQGTSSVTVSASGVDVVELG